MPGFTCCVPGCYNNSHRDRELRFYTFPKDEEQRRLWLQNISRTGVTGCFSTFYPTTGHRVCSAHFPGGRKTYSVKVPTIFPLRGVNERKIRRSRKKLPATSAAGQEDVKPIDLSGPYFFSSSSSSSSPSLPAATAAAVPRPEAPECLDHSYSLSSTTTSEELLRKLNEQKDIIALMEVKIKEMKGTIRQLKVSEAILREELRNKEKLLSMSVIRKKHGM
ncbi:THAP domain-containing protein 11 [Chiloscyllium plagiosum]|uniref:THAP domain-containing protein 11 n=1 Tax=Chiloscyllium plagiosum TaxID=36176 RepID=UPI001CB81B52|nr:THAP domain-containing protein 11 [Chiloscyllium plagiosum]